MGLFPSSSNEKLLGLLERIAVSLERISDGMEAPKKGGLHFRTSFSSPVDGRRGSSISYVNDTESFFKERKALEHLLKGGKPLREGEAPPGPYQPDGQEWAP